MATRVAIITAGGSGMGAHAARTLADAGYEIAVLSSSGKGEALAKEFGGIGVTGSNERPVDLSGLLSQTLAKWGRVDVLVNSAGHGPRGPLLDLTDEDWERGMSVYLMNVVRAARLVTPTMVKQRLGSIVNISSFAAVEPDGAFPTSAVFRAGLAAYTKLFADAYAAHGVRMNNVLPGYINSLPEKDGVAARVPMKRYGKVEEVSELVGFLASEKSSYITGQNIRVDGGLARSI